MQSDAYPLGLWHSNTQTAIQLSMAPRWSRSAGPSGRALTRADGVLECFAAMHEFGIGPSRQATFFGPTVANGALRTWLDLQLSPAQS